MNRLADEASLYLRQHADNPVDWYPWGDDAFAAARERDVPVLLSIGYSSCHWCHVMAHESFESPATAAIMNELFVCVKVDREERPDVDSVYMDAVQAMTGQGGWPLTIFLTADGTPFWGGTYFPDTPRHDMPAFPDVLRGVSAAYIADRERVETTGGQVLSHINTSYPPRERPLPDRDVIADAASALLTRYESGYGGFERAPKFPPPMAIELLLRQRIAQPDEQVDTAVCHTLDAMLWGGIYDQLGGGFHRYSVDNRWLIPHFEKMLYDNAQLARTYTIAWQLWGHERYRRGARETFDFMLRELRLEGGALAASQDADSEGVEGKFYAFSLAELHELLGNDDGTWISGMYGVTPDGNFEHGTSVLSLAAEPEEAEWERLRPLRDLLLQARMQRVAPATDRKAVASWNGLAIGALAEAAAAFGEASYLQAAREIATHLLDVQCVDGVLHRTWHEGGALGEPGFCEDYAHVAWGLLALARADDAHGDRWFTAARELGDVLLDRFDDEGAGGFFSTSSTHASLVVRPKDLSDHPLPSGNSMAATVLAQLAQWYPEGPYRSRAEAAVALVATGITRMPTGLAQAGIALDCLTARTGELVVAGDTPESGEAAQMLQLARSAWRPHLQVAFVGPGSTHPGAAHRASSSESARAYLCEGMTCQVPTDGATQLAAQLDALRR